MENTETVRIAVIDHDSYQEEHPERFNWEIVVNPRERDIGVMLAAEIVTRRGAWLNAGREGCDPLIPGLQEASRLLARRAVWKVSRITVVVPSNSPDQPEQESGVDDHLRRPQRESTATPVSSQRSVELRRGRRQQQMQVARPARARSVGQADGPRDVSYALGVESKKP